MDWTLRRELYHNAVIGWLGRLVPIGVALNQPAVTSSQTIACGVINRMIDASGVYGYDLAPECKGESASGESRETEGLGVVTEHAGHHCSKRCTDWGRSKYPRLDRRGETRIRFGPACQEQRWKTAFKNNPVAEFIWGRFLVVLETLASQGF